MTAKRALVLGLGISGISAGDLLLSLGYAVDGFDDKKENLSHPRIKQLNSLSEVVLSHYGLLIVSPGVPSTHPLLSQAEKDGIETIGELELGARYLNAPAIGITGTNGKTTVTTLVNHALNFANVSARALGNVGVPLCQELAVKPLKGDVAVLELSSFQLETMKTKCLDAAVILNITPDHLDRYSSMQEYAKAKIAIARSLKKGGKLWIYHAIEKEFKPLLEGISYESFGENAKDHHGENVEAALLLCQSFGVTLEKFQASLKTFKKPSHRIEYVSEIDGVKYYDDSKGTNIDAVIKAVNSLSGNIVLIAGGVDKGFPYTSWIEPFKDKIKSILAIGQSAKLIASQLSPHFPVKLFETLELAIVQAKAIAKPGDTVLLSPGCSSYDQFRDYKHRGETFQKIVRNLSKRID